MSPNLKGQSLLTSVIKVYHIYRIKGKIEYFIPGTRHLILKAHANNGRPLGDSSFIEDLEKLTRRVLHKQKPGPKTKADNQVLCPRNYY